MEILILGPCTAPCVRNISREEYKNRDRKINFCDEVWSKLVFNYVASFFRAIQIVII